MSSALTPSPLLGRYRERQQQQRQQEQAHIEELTQRLASLQTRDVSGSNTHSTAACLHSTATFWGFVPRGKCLETLIAVVEPRGPSV